MDGEAIATIQAAWITAQATRYGAWVQGASSLVAGLAVIAAAVIAYRAALAQVQHVKDAEAARKAAYKARMELIVLDYATRIENQWIAAAQVSAALEAPDALGHLGPITDYFPDELNNSNWEHHALLGNAFVQAQVQAELGARLMERWAERNHGDHTLYTNSRVPNFLAEPIQNDDLTLSTPIVYAHEYQAKLAELLHVRAQAILAALDAA